jgi:hypothetical protein
MSHKNVIGVSVHHILYVAVASPGENDHCSNNNSPPDKYFLQYNTLKMMLFLFSIHLTLKCNKQSCRSCSWMCKVCIHLQFFVSYHFISHLESEEVVKLLHAESWPNDVIVKSVDLCGRKCCRVWMHDSCTSQPFMQARQIPLSAVNWSLH